jgi:hypothetical protein
VEKGVRLPGVDVSEGAGVELGEGVVVVCWLGSPEAVEVIAAEATPVSVVIGEGLALAAAKVTEGDGLALVVVVVADSCRTAVGDRLAWGVDDVLDPTGLAVGEVGEGVSGGGVPVVATTVRLLEVD